MTFNPADHPRGGNPANPGEFTERQHSDAEVHLADVWSNRLGPEAATLLPAIASSRAHTLLVTTNETAEDALQLAVAAATVQRRHVVIVPHTATVAEIVGSPEYPGYIAQADGGVLVLENATEQTRVGLDALRQPIESGVLRVQRSGATTEWPADIQLILIARACPCGNPEDTCTCSPMLRRRYRGGLSGPLMDRVGITARFESLSDAELVDTDELAERARTAAERTRAKLNGTPYATWGEVPGSVLRGIDRGFRLPKTDVALLDRALERGAITMRGYDRTLRNAWALAMLEGQDRPDAEIVERALALRQTSAL